MATSRRKWLKQISFSAAGIGLAQLAAAAPVKEYEQPMPQSKLPVRLNANENPYGPSPLSRAAFTQYCNSSNRYNWDLTADLQSAVAVKNKVTTENILLGAGSTEILDLVARYAAVKKGSFLIAEPSYDYWSYPMQQQGLKKQGVPLTADKKIDLAAMLAAIDEDTRLVYICNPNNPTGTCCNREELERFVLEAAKRTMVLADEAYIDYTDQPSLAPLVTGNSNIVIAKTFSKIYGLAGARAGYGIAAKETIEALSNLQSWPNGSMSVATAAVALAALKDETFIASTAAKNSAVKKYTVEQLEKLQLTCIPSVTNFIYFSLSNYKKEYFRLLKESNILGTKIYEEQGNWTRITVGTRQEMEQFIAAIR